MNSNPTGWHITPLPFPKGKGIFWKPFSSALELKVNGVAIDKRFACETINTKERTWLEFFGFRSRITINGASVLVRASDFRNWIWLTKTPTQIEEELKDQEAFAKTIEASELFLDEQKKPAVEKFIAEYSKYADGKNSFSYENIQLTKNDNTWEESSLPSTLTPNTSSNKIFPVGNSITTPSPTSLSKEKNPITGVIGIHNQGNTCFMNAAFQLIMNDSVLLNALVETYTELSKNDTNPAYQAFLTAVTAYQNGQINDVDLNPLRALNLDKKARQSGKEGDIYEFILALLAPVQSKSHPNLFFNIKQEKTYKLSTIQDPNVDVQYKNRDAKERSEWIETYRTTLPSDGVLTKTTTSPNFIIDLNTEEQDGQKLLDKTFQKTINKEDDVGAAIYMNDGEYKNFYAESEHLILETAPQQFMVSLKRFGSNNTGEAFKIEKPIHMPEQITLPLANGSTQTYKLKSIAVHTGAHYYALIKRPNQEWQMANDSSITKASKEELDRALSLGYVYSYEKC